MTLLGECVEKAHEKILLHYDDIKDIIAITMASTSPAVYKQGLSLLQKVGVLFVCFFHLYCPSLSPCVLTLEWGTRRDQYFSLEMRSHHR